MMILSFACAVFLLLAGHYFRMMRWKQFVEIYEQPSRSRLLRSLSIGYAVNFFVPFRIGDLLRAFLTGRHLKNGFGFALSTIILDYCLDVPAVALVFWALCATTPELIGSAVWYSVFFALLVMCGLLALRFNGAVKKMLRAVCSIFNSHIEFNLLFFFWGGISAVKDCFSKVDRKRLLVRTGCMWGCYLASYAMIAHAATVMGAKTSFREVFAALFASGNIYTTSSVAQKMPAVSMLMVCYLLVALVLLFAISFIPQNWKRRMIILEQGGAPKEEQPILNLLPQVKEKDRLEFLERYFSNERREYLKQYIMLNRDIRILQDFSAGSNATTMLCMDEEHTFYRKYAFGKDGDKLYEQVEWLEQHKNDLFLPEILKLQRGEGYCSYDMAYDTAAVGLFHYIHSRSLDESWGILRTALEDLSEHLHTKHVRPADPAALQKYIDEKIWGNVRKVEKAREFRNLLPYNELCINGKTYRNLEQLKPWLEPDRLKKIFSGDMYADVHGDLTVENLICWDDGRQPAYYFIDPNTGNLHESPALDFAKLLQSLHGGYEFLMRTEKVSVQDNQITFLSTCSKSYTEVFEQYRAWLEQKFSREQVRSIFFHEIVHWLRLLPYKIEKNGKRAVLFYAGFIMVFNDVIEWYGEE